MNRDHIDELWNQALQQSIKDKEHFTRYHFATLVATDEREAVCRIVTGLCISDNNAEEINRAIRARGQT